MFKKIIFTFFGLLLLTPHSFAYAGVIFNEVQLNPTTERFIELYNSDDVPIDLTGWYIQRKTQTGTSFSSLVSNPNFTNKTIGARGYFVISRSQLPKSDIVLDTLTLTESNTIQIKNGEGIVVDKIGWGSAADCIVPCPSNPTDGNSLQLISGSWSVAVPTPGVTNEVEIVPAFTPSSSGGGYVSPTQTTTNTSPKIVEVPAIKTKIIVKNLAFTGLPVEFKANTTGLVGEPLNYGKYFWNFGDGDSKEIYLNNTEKVIHTYFYVGEYPVSLEYYKDYYSENPDAISKIIMKVVPMAVSISKVGDVNDFFIELSNNSNYEIDISKWSITSLGKIFTLPKNTSILAKNKVILSPKITNLNFEDSKNLKLITQAGQLIFDYGAFLVAPVETKSAEIPKTVENNVLKTESISNKNTVVSDRNILVSDTTPVSNIDISANVLKADVLNKSSINIPMITFGCLLLLGGGTVYFIRRRGVLSQNKDEFDILDE